MKIKINGRFIEETEKSLFALAKKYGFESSASVIIKNGYQFSEDAEINDNDEIVLIEKGKFPNEDELEAMLSARNTPKVQEKLKSARAAIAGLGGIGSAVAISLARTGIGTLHLVDFDIVEPSNLNRQQYSIKHLGMKKTEALKMQISEINPYVKIITDFVRIDENNCLEIFKDDKIVCEAFDKPECKAMLANTLLENRDDVFVVAASGMAGLEKSNTIRTKRIGKRFYLCGDFETDSREGAGLMAPRVAICAGHQANAILHIITENYEI